MPAEPTPGADYRVLILPPTRRDGEVTCAVLERAGMSCLVCDDAAALAEEIQAGFGAIVLTDAIAGDGNFARLTATLDRQASWSDAPTVLLSRTNHLSSATTRLLAALRNVTVLDRPTSTRTLVSAVQAAIRARRRQYQIRDQMNTLREVQEREEHERGWPPEVVDFFKRELASGQYPLISDVFGEEIDSSFDAVFEFLSQPGRFERGLNRLLDGIEAELNPPK